MVLPVKVDAGSKGSTRLGTVLLVQSKNAFVAGMSFVSASSENPSVDDVVDVKTLLN